MISHLHTIKRGAQSVIADEQWHEMNRYVARLDPQYSQALKRLNWLRHIHTQPNTSHNLALVAVQEYKAQEQVNLLAKALAKYMEHREYCYEQYVYYASYPAIPVDCQGVPPPPAALQRGGGGQRPS